MMKFGFVKMYNLTSVVFVPILSTNHDASYYKKKVGKTENASSSGYLFKVYEVKGENHMLNQLKPLLFAIRLLFRLPYTIDSRGRLTLQWFSVWSLYTLIGYVIQCSFTLELIMRLYEQLVVETDFLQVGKIAVNIIVIMNLLFIPLSALLEWKGYCIYLNQWIELQCIIEKWILMRFTDPKLYQLSKLINVYRENRNLYLVNIMVDFEDITGKPFNTQMNLLIKIFVLIIAIQSYVTVNMTSSSLIQPYWYHKYVFMLFFLSFPLQLFLWVVCQYESGRMAALLKQHIIEVLGSDNPMNNAAHAFQMRMLWLRLVYIVKLFGNASFTIICLLSISGIISLCGAYVILSGIITGDPRTQELFGPVIIAVFTLVIISELSHRTTVQVGSDICESLVNLKSVAMNQETTSEVERFLRIAAFNAPVVSLAGLFTIGRSTLVSISKNVITYLIVLIQFQLTTDEEHNEVGHQKITYNFTSAR